jgi:hypothetical protein
VALPILSEKSMHNFYRKKSSPKLWATSVIFEKLTEENYRPKGENSPNLVTLAFTYTALREHLFPRNRKEGDQIGRFYE